jgi:hypothetical protein
MAQWVPYAFPEGEWWSTVEVNLVIQGDKKIRLLLDTAIEKSYIFKSVSDEIAFGGNEYPFAWRRSASSGEEVFTALIDTSMSKINDVSVHFRVVEEAVADIPRKKKIPILSQENYLVLKNYATENWVADSIYEGEKKRGRKRKQILIDGVLGTEYWPIFQINSPIVSVLTKKQGIKWTSLGTILTVNK